MKTERDPLRSQDSGSRRNSNRFDYLLVEVVSVVVLFLDFFLCDFFFALVSVEVFWANTAVPDNRDKANAAVMIILIFLGISLI
jgi:hypothetical protein